MSSDQKDLFLLRQAFEEFMAKSAELESAYTRLKEESQNLSAYLGSILENMEDAILVITGKESLVLWNSPALRYLPLLGRVSPPVSLETVLDNVRFDIRSFLEGEEDHLESVVEIDEKVCEISVSRRPFFSIQKKLLGRLLIIHDQTEIKRLERRSRQEDRLRVMGELAAEMAHEIRNPLGSIELMVSLLEQDMPRESAGSSLVTRLRSAVQSMNHTVSNVLLYTREIQLKRRPAVLAELFSHAETAIMTYISRQALTLSRSLPDITLSLDIELMQQALANLLLNAAQVSPPKGTISITGERDERHLLLTISDQGPGISQEARGKLFTPFFTTKNSGTGLGLAMVKRVVEAHNGEIACLPNTPGASFQIRLPLE